VTPPISLLMYDGPGRALGQVAFPAVSLLFGCVAPAFFRDLRRVTGAAHPGLVATSAAAFAGLAVVGAVPLQRDVPAVMRGEARLGADSVLHQSAAAVFFAAAIAHMALWMRLCVTSPPASPLSYRVGWRSALFKGACALTSVFPLPAAFLLHPASPARRVLSLSEADAGGLQQYCLVLCVASFFASYSVELAGALDPAGEQRESKRD